MKKELKAPEIGVFFTEGQLVLIGAWVKNHLAMIERGNIDKKSAYYREITDLANRVSHVTKRGDRAEPP